MGTPVDQPWKNKPVQKFHVQKSMVQVWGRFLIITLVLLCSGDSELPPFPSPHNRLERRARLHDSLKNGFIDGKKRADQQQKTREGWLLRLPSGDFLEENAFSWKVSNMLKGWKSKEAYPFSWHHASVSKWVYLQIAFELTPIGSMVYLPIFTIKISYSCW